MRRMSVLEQEGLMLLRAGVSIIPVRGKTPPLETWLPYQHTPLTEQEFLDLVEAVNPTGIAVIGGMVSGGLEILDFDYQCGQTFWPVFKQRAGTALHGLQFQRTGSRKGFQGAYRCARPGPNQVLAQIPTGKPGSPWAPVIETRGEGGYAIVPPSWHPVSKKHYEYIPGHHFANVTPISDDQRETLLHIARALTLRIETLAPRAPRPAPSLPADRRAEASVVKELYNQKVAIEDVLERRGYAIRGKYAIRPGGKRKTVRIEGNRSYHNATSDPECDGNGTQGYWRTPFEFLLKYDCHGDFREAIAHAARVVGVELVTGSRSMEHDMPPMPPPPPGPPPPPPGMGGELVIVTNDPSNEALLRSLGVPVIVDAMCRYTPDLARSMRQYEQRLVACRPPADGPATLLAVNLQAKLLELPPSGTTSTLDLIAMIRSAHVPSYRIGHQLGRA